MTDENKHRSPSPSRNEFDQVKRTVSNHDISLKAVNAAIELMKGSVSEQIARALDTARGQASAALEPLVANQRAIERKVDRMIYMLDQREKRDVMEAELKAKIIEERAREEARVNEQVNQRLSLAEGTGRFLLAEEERKETIVKRKASWWGIVFGAVALLGTAVGWIISHVTGR